MKKFKNMVAAITLLIGMGVSHASTLSFDNITNNTTVNLSPQLSVVSTAAGAGVEFTFTNNATENIASSITDIYFDLGAYTGLFTSSIISGSSDGVSFDTVVSPSNLPGGNEFNFTSDFGGDSTSPQTLANGVNATGEFVTFLLTLGAGFSYDDYISGVLDGTVRIGMHIQGIGEGSDSYINTPNVVPVPAAGILFATVLLGAGIYGRRKVNTRRRVNAYTRN